MSILFSGVRARRDSADPRAVAKTDAEFHGDGRPGLVSIKQVKQSPFCYFHPSTKICFKVQMIESEARLKM